MLLIEFHANSPGAGASYRKPVRCHLVQDVWRMGQWWCGPVTVTAGVGDKGAGGVGVGGGEVEEDPQSVMGRQEMDAVGT